MPHDIFSIEVPLRRGPAQRMPDASWEGGCLRAAEMLVLAYEMQNLINEGAVESRAAMARVADLTKARITQIMNLLWLAPDIQEEILFMTSAKGRDPVTVKVLLPIARIISWDEQRRRWRALVRVSRGQLQKM